MATSMSDVSDTQPRKRRRIHSTPVPLLGAEPPGGLPLPVTASSPFLSLPPDLILNITRNFFIFRISLVQPDATRCYRLVPFEGTPVLQRPQIHIPDPKVFHGYFSRDPTRQIHLIFASYWCKRFQDCWLLPFRYLRYLGFRTYYSGEELGYFRDALSSCSCSDLLTTTTTTTSSMTSSIDYDTETDAGVVDTIADPDTDQRGKRKKVRLVLSCLESLEGVALRWKNRSPRWHGHQQQQQQQQQQPYSGKLMYSVLSQGQGQGQGMTDIGTGTGMTTSTSESEVLSVSLQRRNGKEKRYCWNWKMLRADVEGDEEEDESIRNHACQTLRVLATSCPQLLRLELEIGMINMRVVLGLGWDEVRTDGMHFGPWNEPMPPFFEVFLTPEFVEQLSSFPNLRSLTLRTQRPRPWSMLPRRDEDSGDLFDDDALPSVVRGEESSGGGAGGVDFLQFLLQDPYLSLSRTRGAEFATVGVPVVSGPRNDEGNQQQQGLEFDIANPEHKEVISRLSKGVVPQSSMRWRIPEPRSSRFLRLPTLRKLEVLDVPIHFLSLRGHVQNLVSLFLRGTCVSAFHLFGIVSHPRLEKVYLVNSVIRGDIGQLFFRRLKVLNLSLSLFAIDGSIPRKFEEGAAGISSISLRTLRRPLDPCFVHQLWRGLSRYPSATPLPRILDIAFTNCGDFHRDIFLDRERYRPEEGRDARIVADVKTWRKVSSDDTIETGECHGYLTLT